MPRRWVFLLCLLAGCSTHPCADFRDYFHAGKMYPNRVTPYGGTCIPQGPVLPPAGNLPTITGPGVSGPGVVPPPLPLPGTQPAVPFTGTIQPIPPPPTGPLPSGAPSIGSPIPPPATPGL